MAVKLSDDFCNNNPQLKSIRQAFGEELTSIATNDQRIVALAADLAGSVGLTSFRNQLANRYIEVGIAEQNMVSIASGLAHMGKIPFAASYAAFSPGRNWEQIRTNVCLNSQPVKLIGAHAGLNVGADGATHQMLEDIALMQSLPNMVVLSPVDVVEARQMVQAMINSPQPNYIRLPRCDSPIVVDCNDYFRIGQAYLLYQDDRPIVTIISTGIMTANCLLAAKQLAKKSINCQLVHVPTIKPLDKESILSLAGRTPFVAVVEEGQINGGLGSTVASLILSSNIRPTAFQTIAVNDQFGQTGTVEQLWNHYGLGVDQIASKIKSLLDL